MHLTYVYTVYRHVFGWVLGLCTQEARERSLSLSTFSPQDRTVQGIQVWAASPGFLCGRRDRNWVPQACTARALTHWAASHRRLDFKSHLLSIKYKLRMWGTRYIEHPDVSDVQSQLKTWRRPQDHGNRTEIVGDRSRRWGPPLPLSHTCLLNLHCDRGIWFKKNSYPRGKINS